MLPVSAQRNVIQSDDVEGTLLATGAEVPPNLNPTLTPSAMCVVCARLVVAPTLAAVPTSRLGRLMETPTLA